MGGGVLNYSAAREMDLPYNWGVEVVGGWGAGGETGCSGGFDLPPGSRLLIIAGRLYS